MGRETNQDVKCYVFLLHVKSSLKAPCNVSPLTASLSTQPSRLHSSCSLVPSSFYPQRITWTSSEDQDKIALEQVHPQLLQDTTSRILKVQRPTLPHHDMHFLWLRTRAKDPHPEGAMLQGWPPNLVQSTRTQVLCCSATTRMTPTRIRGLTTNTNRHTGRSKTENRGR